MLDTMYQSLNLGDFDYMKKIIELIKKNKQIILYLIFGALTTALNVVTYWLFAHPIGLSTLPSTIIAWVAGVIFAFFTNKFIVFEAKQKKGFWVELGSFVLARVVTGVLDMLIMLVFVDYLHLNDLVIKIVSNIVVIILNYVFSKFIIFRKKKQGEENEGISKE